MSFLFHLLFIHQFSCFIYLPVITGMLPWLAMFVHKTLNFSSVQTQLWFAAVDVSVIMCQCVTSVNSLHCIAPWTVVCVFIIPLPSSRQHPSYVDCLEVKRKYYQNCSVLGCVTQCSQSAAHSYEQFLQVQQIGFVTLGPLRCA